MSSFLLFVKTAFETIKNCCTVSLKLFVVCVDLIVFCVRLIVPPQNFPYSNKGKTIVFAQTTNPFYFCLLCQINCILCQNCGRLCRNNGKVLFQTHKTALKNEDFSCSSIILTTRHVSFIVETDSSLINIA